MKTTAKRVAMLLVLVAPATAGAGLTFDQVPVEYWAGSGPNEAMLVLNFPAANYAFGYRWDGAATSWDMIAGVADGGGVDITYDAYVFGNLLTSISYDGHTLADDYYGTGDWIAFWVSGEVAWTEYVYDWTTWELIDTIEHPAWDGDGETWLSPAMGISDRELREGFWDAYGQENISNGFDPIHPPVLPAGSPVPEPATAALLGLGLVALAGRMGRTRR